MEKKRYKTINIFITNSFCFSPLSKKKKALQDALAFIDSVKLAYLPTKPYVYNLFLATMREFRTGGYVYISLPSLPTPFSH